MPRSAARWRTASARNARSALATSLTAGATWNQIAAATGSNEASVRQVYRKWADGQHELWLLYEGKFGMDAAEHAEALRKAAEPGIEAGQ